MALGELHARLERRVDPRMILYLCLLVAVVALAVFFALGDA